MAVGVAVDDDGIGIDMQEAVEMAEVSTAGALTAGGASGRERSVAQTSRGRKVDGQLVVAASPSWEKTTWCSERNDDETSFTRV